MDGKEYLKLNERKAKEYPQLLKDGYAEYLEYNRDLIDKLTIFSIPQKNVFAGYYDIDNISPNGKNMFCLVVGKNANPSRNYGYINIVDLENNTFVEVEKTRAWNWQQGSRIRWIDNDRIMFNDYVDNKYISVVYDLVKKQRVKTFDLACYDINFKRNVGLGLNFDRLQMLRPGYGYSNNKNVPTDDVIFEDGIDLIDFETEEIKRIITFKDLTENLKLIKGKKHYLNHISLSPSGDKFSFFHLWTKDSLDMWNMNFIVSDLDGNFKILESEDIISHYTWIDEENIMVTKVSNGGKCYVVYNVESGEKYILENDVLVQDGHPTFINKDQFVTDTYPLEHCIQKLFLSGSNEKHNSVLLRAFSDPRYYIEKRCDMHPKFDKNTNTVNIDSTYSEGVRKIIHIKLR